MIYSLWVRHFMDIHIIFTLAFGVCLYILQRIDRSRTAMYAHYTEGVFMKMCKVFAYVYLLFRPMLLYYIERGSCGDYQ